MPWLRRVFPREWEQFVAVVPEANQNRYLAVAYARLLTHIVVVLPQAGGSVDELPNDIGVSGVLISLGNQV